MDVKVRKSDRKDVLFTPFWEQFHARNMPLRVKQMGLGSEKRRLFARFCVIYALLRSVPPGPSNRAGSGTWLLFAQNPQKVPESAVLRRKTHYFTLF